MPESIISIILVLAAGFIVTIVVVVKPKLFWISSILVAIFGSGFMISGYALVDEYFLGFILLAGLILIFTRRKSISFSDANLHETVFILLVFYLILQSFRGMILLDDWRIIRYAIYFIMLGMFSYAIHRWSFFNLSEKTTLLILVCSGILYFVFYLTHGVYFEYILGPLGRFSKQGELWSGSAYAMFPLVVLVPSAILLFDDSSKKYRLFSILFFMMSVFAASYFESRIGLTCLIIFSVLAIARNLYNKQVISSIFYLLILLSTILLWSIPIDNFITEPKKSFVKSFSYEGAASVNALVDSGNFVFNPRTSDLDRNQQIFATLNYIKLNLLKDDINKALFGEGFYKHKTAIIPYVKQLGAKINTNGIVRPIGISAFVIDTGIVGLLLLLFNFWLVASSIIKSDTPFPNKIIILIALLITFIWLFISNILDSFLFFLLIMPSGLLIKLSHYSSMSNVNKELEDRLS